jgi:hypothetical protein
MISRKRIDQLINKADELNISITLPTHKKGEEVQQDPIRFKNLLNSVEKELRENGLKDTEIDKYLKEPKKLLDDLQFWNHADEGMAIYINKNFFEIFELPYKLSEQAYVNDHFLITPLLPMISLEGSYHILALSQKNVRLLKCNRMEAVDVTPDDIFTSIEEFIEEKPEVQLQFHTGAGNHEAMFFGHGGSDEDKKVIVEKYLRGVEESITKKVKESGDPLILAATEELIPVYKSLNKYNRLLDDSISGSPGEMKDKELQEAGWKIIRQFFLKDMYKAIDQFKDEGSERVSNNLSQIVESTVMGKTDTLFIAKDEVSWGVYDEDQHTVHFSNSRNGKNNELLNWTALKAYEQGGKVFVLPKSEMPYVSTVAALFRF